MWHTVINAGFPWGLLGEFRLLDNQHDKYLTWADRLFFLYWNCVLRADLLVSSQWGLKWRIVNRCLPPEGILGSGI